MRSKLLGNQASGQTTALTLTLSRRRGDQGVRPPQDWKFTGMSTTNDPTAALRRTVYWF